MGHFAPFFLYNDFNDNFFIGAIKMKALYFLPIFGRRFVVPGLKICRDREFPDNTAGFGQPEANIQEKVLQKFRKLFSCIFCFC